MPISVLLIDDEKMLRDIASSYLVHMAGDITVDTVESAETALEKIPHGAFDVIVSDYEMTGISGIELLKRLKSDGNTVPFILFTGRGREEIALEALNNGAAFYIQKGGEPKSQFAELIHKIREAVRRDRAERESKEIQQRMAYVLDFLPDPTIAIDKSGKLIVWNRAAEVLTGVPGSSLLGKDNYEYSIPFYGERRPLLLDLVLYPDERKLAGYYQVTKNAGDLIFAESRITLRDKRVRVLWIKATLLQDGSGKITGAIETVRDITVRKQISEERDRIRQNLLIKNEEIVQANERLAAAEKDLRTRNEELSEAFEELAAVEEELRQTFSELEESHKSVRESEEDYRQLVESLPDAVVVHKSGEILYENPAALILFGEQSHEGIPRKAFWERFAAGCRDELCNRSQQVQTDGHAVPHLESCIAKPDGSAVLADMTLCPVRHRGKNVILTVLRDITERRRYEEEICQQTKDLERQARALARANQTISLMGTVTRHDILNQLSVLQGYLSLGKELVADDTLRMYMEREEAAADSICRHILFTRDYKEIGMHEPEWQRIKEVVSRAFGQVTTGRIRCEVDGAGVEIYADHMLEKVFYNLIDNSLRHGGQITTIRVSFSEEDGAVMLVYEDDGDGIPAGEKERIFEKGYGKNTGLGLFLVREILAITGITIAETGERGCGARFSMVIPNGAYRRSIVAVR